MIAAPQNATARFSLPGYSEYECLDAASVTNEHEANLLGIQEMVASKVFRWLRRLSPRERAQFDATDTTQEVWLHLWRKIRYYKPEYAFTTFAGRVIDQCLAKLYLRTRLVSPKTNPYKLMEKAWKNGDEDEMEALRISLREASTIEDGYLMARADHSRCVEEREEELEVARLKIERAVEKLGNPLLAAVLCLEYGLFGQTPLQEKELMHRLEISLPKLSSLKSKALKELKVILEADMGE